MLKSNALGSTRYPGTCYVVALRNPKRFVVHCWRIAAKAVAAVAVVVVGVVVVMVVAVPVSAIVVA